MSRRAKTGRDPSDAEWREAVRVGELHPLQQAQHPSTVPADAGKLGHINSYGELPKFYIDRPFTCRKCGKRQIWKAADQKWYYEDAKGHIDAIAVDCHECRTRRMAR